MAVAVHDLEVALVLARELRAKSRRASPSLLADQLRQLFGAVRLDPAECLRIQTALEMAGLDLEPSLVDAETDTPINLTAARPGSASRETAPPAGDPPSAPAERTEFPTLGEFTRAAIDRTRRRRKPGNEDGGLENGSASIGENDQTVRRTNGGTPYVPGHNGWHPADFDDGQRDPGGSDAVEDSIPSAGDSSHQRESVLSADEVLGAEPDAPDQHGVKPDAPDQQLERKPSHETKGSPDLPEAEVSDELLEEAIIHELPAGGHSHELPPGEESNELPPGEESNELPAGESIRGSSAPDAVHELPPIEHSHGFSETDAVHELPAAGESQGEESTDAPAAVTQLAPQHPATEQAQPNLAAVAVVAAAAAAIPVLVTSIAGWRFGLPYLALTLIATAWLVARSSTGGGMVGALRASPGAGRAFRLTGALTMAGLLATVLLAGLAVTHRGVRRGPSSRQAPAHVPLPPVRAIAVPPSHAAPSDRGRTRPNAQRPSDRGRIRPSAPRPSPPSRPSSPDNSTQGLIEVPQPPPASPRRQGGASPPGTGTTGR